MNMAFVETRLNGALSVIDEKIDAHSKPTTSKK